MNVDVEGLPDELKDLPNWVAWKKEWYCGRPIKMPRNPRTGRTVSVLDAGTWSTLPDALASQIRADGVGFVLTDSPYIGIDIDDCMDGGRLQRKAWKVVERFGSYAELSPSGRGVHIIGRGKAVFHDGGSQWGRRQAGLMGFKSFEVYNSARYLTMTGRVLDGYESVADVQNVLDAMTAALWPRQSAEQEPEPGEPDKQQESGMHQNREQEPLEESFLLQQAGKGRRGEWFRSLYERGELARYGGDHSRADMALLGELAFWTNGDALQMERLFSASALGRREKWRTRQDYRERTIQAALSHWNGKCYKKGR